MSDTFETRPTFESKETQVEKKETKESEMTPEEQAAATKERADLLVKEVRTSKSMMKNILIHISQVKNLIKQIRAQLQLASQQNDETVSSTAQDQKKVDQLKQKIAEYKEELFRMKEELIRAEIIELQTTRPEQDQTSRERLAQEHVEKLLKSIDEEI
tara:strand:+ start:1328 stop:1801 length:474 start_codon:yes stop_codon:yes gene_type:complete